MSEAAAAATLEGEGLEGEFLATQEILLHPPRVQRKTLLLLGSVAAFIAIMLFEWKSSPLDLAMLVGVLFVHELGHAAAMQLFGYRDVRIFFIPFLGAATAGRKRGVAAWKEAIVLLAGPLPGIVAGCALAFVNEPHASTLALELLVVNGLNLLPLTPLDGGRLFQLVLFSRRRTLEIIFIGAAGAILVVAAIAVREWPLAVLGYLVLLTLGHKRRVLTVAQSWRERKVPDDPAALDESQRRALFWDMWQMLPPKWRLRWRGKPKPQAQTMSQILESAALTPPSWAATVLVLAIWLAGIGAALFGTVGAAAVPRWRIYTHEAPRFSVEMPRAPREKMLSGHRPVWEAALGLRRAYMVSWTRRPGRPAQAWLDTRERALVATGRFVRQLPAPDNERRFVYVTKGKTMTTRVVYEGDLAFALLAVSPGEEPDSERFVDSFSPLP